jgi:hypothetical protein
MGVSDQENSGGIPIYAWKRKEEIRRLLISVFILLIVGVFLYFLVPYANNMRLKFEMASSLMLSIFLLPLFWGIIGWTLMQFFATLGIVKSKQTKLSRLIYLAILVLLLLYMMIMIPFIIETLQSTFLSFQYHKHPATYPDGFSYSYQIPVFLQTIESKTLIFLDGKSSVFIVFGVILRICRPDKQRGSTIFNDI